MPPRFFCGRFAPTLWLVVALLWAPIWGQWHNIAHRVHLVHQVVTVADSAPDSAFQGHHSEDHAAGSALCQVLAHLGEASALASWPVGVLLQGLPQAVLPSLACWSHGHRLRWAIQARAPPAQI